MNKRELKAELKRRFKEVYGKEHRLLAIHLNGFTHSIIYDSGTADSIIHQDEYSAYTSFENDEKTRKVLSDIPHYCYKHNATELCYVLPQNR